MQRSPRRRLGLLSLLFATTAAIFCIVDARSAEMLVVEPQDDSTQVIVQTASPIGRIALWVPEAVMSEHGACAIYPQGARWHRVNGIWRQSIETEESYGSGNYRRINSEKIDFVGIKLPIDESVSWTTELIPGEGRITFEIRLRNAGAKRLRCVGGAVCVKFLDANWWSDETTLAICDGVPVSLARLGREVGTDNRFEAYLVRGQRFANPFYVSFWGFNPRRLDRAMLVSEHRAAKCCAVVSSKQAYFMHSNLANPCTDVMLSFGDVEASAEAVARGIIAVAPGSAEHVITNELKR